MIIKKTLGGTKYQNNSRTLTVWLCDSINNKYSVFIDNVEGSRKSFVLKEHAIEYVNFLINGE